MADTIIPKPDPTAAVTPTFEPAPVTTPAPTTTASAASPSALGVAAPGVQPNPTSTAPGAIGVAGANPTTAGTAPAAAGKEAISTLATPTPLPAEAAKPPVAPAPATTQPGAAPVKPAADAAGAAAPAAKTTAAPKTGNAAALDILAPVNDTVKKMLEGNDPIATIQYNQILNGNGPKNQAMLQGLGMKLKQQNLDGQGAGSALLAMMARDAEFTDDQLRANVSADSAKRLYDMNLHGFDKAIEINQEKDRQVRTDLSTALQNGQLDAAKDLFGQVFPGIPFDEGAAKAASPQAAANFNSRMKLVDQFVSQGNADQAKAVFDQLANDMPEMFGFPNDPAGAKAAMAGVDFKTEAWQNNLKASNDASAAARTAALQGDASGLSSAIDQIFAKMTPAAVEGLATSAVKSRPLDEINKILAASGMAPVASTDEAAMLDKTKFAKAVKSYDLMKDAHKTATDGLLDIFSKADPAMAIDPAARQAAKAWIDSHVYAISNSSDGMDASVDPSKLNKDQLPPWDVNSPQAYMYYSWPVAKFNTDGSVAEYTIEDPIAYHDDYKPGDLTTEKGREDARLDKAYQDYKMATPADALLPIKSWYYATAGGNKPVAAAQAKDPAVAPPAPGTQGGVVATNALVDSMSSRMPAGMDPEAEKKMLQLTASNTQPMPEVYNPLYGGRWAEPAHTPANQGYYAYKSLMERGLSSADAAQLAISAVGLKAFSAGYKDSTGKAWV